MESTILLVGILFGCSPGNTEPSAARGQALYASNCTSCHASDPAKVGSVGPDVLGSSLELLKAKVLEGVYPKDYKPKRDTHMMPKFQFDDGAIKSLSLYLERKF